MKTKILSNFYKYTVKNLPTNIYSQYDSDKFYNQTNWSKKQVSKFWSSTIYSKYKSVLIIGGEKNTKIKNALINSRLLYATDSSVIISDNKNALSVNDIVTKLDDKIDHTTKITIYAHGGPFANDGGIVTIDLSSPELLRIPIIAFA